MTSDLGNSDTIYRLYRRVSKREEPPGPLYDAPAYNQVAVTLSLADDPEPFWSRYYWLGDAWIETPALVTNARYGEFLVVPGRYAGTGRLVEDHVFMPTAGRTWTEIGAAQLDQENGDGWLRQLQSYLPEGHYIAKGVRVDYATLTGETTVWRRDDPNCCPSGGRIRFTLKVAVPEPSLAVAETNYVP